MTYKEMAEYLRCTNAPGDKRTRVCDSTCPYHTLEEVRKDFPCPPDITIDGVSYWTGCDYEQISEDAAKMLEDISIRMSKAKECVG